MKNQRLKKSERDALSFQRDMLLAAKRDGANEANTRQHIDRILTDALGYSLREVDAEYLVNGKKCDIALWDNDRHKGSPIALIECKKVSDALRSSDVTNQMKNYAYETNVRWVMLVNGLQWNVYAVEAHGGRKACVPLFSIDMEGGLDDRALGLFAAISHGAISKGSLKALKGERDKASMANAFVLAQLIMGDDIVSSLIRSIKKISGCKIDADSVRRMLESKVLRDGLLKDAPTRAEVRAAKKAVSVLAEARGDTTASLPQGDFVLKGRGVEAHGRPVDGGFLVYAGTPVCGPVPSFAQRCASAKKVRDALIADGTIADGRLARDFVFSSPSAAACVVMGRSSNGPKEWRTEDGRALGDAVRP